MSSKKGSENVVSVEEEVSLNAFGEPLLDSSELSTGNKILSIFWDPFGRPPKERKFLLKIDFFIFLYAILSSFLKYIDQTNILVTYVSGMKEDLNMLGNDRNFLTTYFNIGYLVFSIPMTLLVNNVKPSKVLPTCEVIWAILTLAMGLTKSKKAIFGLRFVQGVCESCLFPTLVLILSEWYGPLEIAKRLSFLNLTSCAAGIFSGFLQSAILATLDGKLGRPGWQWLFIIDGLMTVPVGLIGYFCIPDFPDAPNSAAKWLSKEDIEFQKRRYDFFGKKKPVPYTWKRVVKVLLSWQLWSFVFGYVFLSCAPQAQNYFNIWLQSINRYSLVKLNMVATAPNAFFIVWTFVFSSISDYFRWRYWVMMFGAVVGMVGLVLLTVWDIPFGLKFTAFMICQGLYALQTVYIAWATELYVAEPDIKGLLVAAGNTFAYCTLAWLPLVAYNTKATDAHFKIGYPLSIGMQVIAVLAITLVKYLNEWHQRKNNYVLNSQGYWVPPDSVIKLEDEPLELESS